ncbi:hypothetical protein KUTeg_017754 [Tegillarca granosa]|uniref:Transducer of regulated CREB activity C-terminal domain-containing protein n=1 Tax=Tegillarca granosa TaxID=220873 RepID=A0ABQ9EIC3_TEGGR|nr:hypothetical protein KUTeg_017754 [Tegillarca granosa]
MNISALLLYNFILLNEKDADESFAKELGNAITGFDNDFFPSDEALKVGLDPLDLDGLQMLTDPNMITDPETEQSFKLDRL